jgi:transketolase
MLDRVAAACSELDVAILYAASVRPFDGETLRTVLRSPEVIIVEPYLEGTSSAQISTALAATPHRQLNVGVRRAEHRHHGTIEEHDTAHGLDVDGIRARIIDFLKPGGAQ